MAGASVTESPKYSRMEKMRTAAESGYPHCRDHSQYYEKLNKIGQGTFGEVYKAQSKETKEYVAMKKVLMETETEGFPITALREIRILQLLKNVNIVNLIETCRTKPSAFNRYRSTFYLVFEFCDHDLAGLLSNKNVKFSLGDIKSVIQQLLSGLYFMHANKIIHRDIKSANILITKSGVLKLADFGLARAISNTNTVTGQTNRYTNRVVTLWYRPPELLLGERMYGPEIDMWGAGCLMAEMWTRAPIMQGHTEQHQLTLISQLCGSISPDVWPGVENIALYNSLQLAKGQKRKVVERLRPYVRDQMGVDLIDKLLCLNPRTRLDADSALNHDFLWNEPGPADLGKMLSQHSGSMFELFTPARASRGGGGAGHPSNGGPPNGGAGQPPHGGAGAQRPGPSAANSNAVYERVY